MSGLGETSGFYGDNVGGGPRVQQRDIDQYVQYELYAPSVDTAYMATVSSATAGALFVIKSVTPDSPRNLAYAVTGGATGQGGTFRQPGFDQFGSAILEQVVIGSANGGGTTQGTAIFGSIGIGTYSPNGQAGSTGTAKIGFGTAAGVTGNWFGLPVKITGTADVRSITWYNSQVATPLNKGTNLGSLISPAGGTTPPHAFQGTSGVANTDAYSLTIKPQFDNVFKPEMTNL